MIHTSQKRVLPVLAVLTLAAAGCTVSAAGQIPCADDSSCPIDFPVCGSAGKCEAGTPTNHVTAQIVGVAGKQTGAPVRGAVTVQVSAKSSSGVKSLTLNGGGKTFSAAAGAPGPVYDFSVDTATLTDGTISFTATVTPGDDSGAVTSPAFALTVDNTAPVLTSSATLPAAPQGGLVTLDVTASEALGTLTATILLSGDPVGTATEVAPPTGNVHHLGFALTSNALPASYSFSVTALDLAGNPTASALTKPFTVAAPPTAGLSANLGTISVGDSATLTAAVGNGTGTIAAVPADASLPGTVTNGQTVPVSPAADTVYTLTVTNAAGAITTSTARVFVAPDVTPLSLTSATANPGQNANLTATAGAMAKTAFIEPGHLPVTTGAPQSVSVNAAQTTTFTLVATNAAGKEFRTAGVLTVTQPSVASFSAPAFVTTGSGPTLTVKFTPATATATVPGCTGGTVTGTSPASRTFTCTAIATLTTYTASVALGTSTATATANVDVAEDPNGAALNFTGGPGIAPGDFANFSGAGCTGCAVTFNPPLTPLTGAFASPAFTARLTANPTETTIVTMTVTNAAGAQVTRTATATVTQPAIVNFTGPAVVTAGQPFNLTAQFNPSTASGTVAGCGTGAVTGSNPSQQIFSCSAIVATTPFTLNLTLGSTTIHSTITVQFAPDPAAGLTFTASPPLMPFNALSAVTLSSSFCAGCTATYTINGGTPLPMTPTVSQPQSATSTYTLLVENAAGTTASAQLTVPTFKGTVRTSAMASARNSPAAVLLANGKILVAGGSTDTSRTNALDTAEIFDPATGTWSAVQCTCGPATCTNGGGTPQDKLHVPRFQAAAAVLSDGRVLIAGGANNASASLQSVDIYDPVEDCFHANTTSMNTARVQHTATAYGATNAVIIGGGSNSCEVYAPGSAIENGTFTNCSGTNGTMQTSRAGHVAVLLANRYVLVAGGATVSPRSADIYDTNSNGTSGFTALSTTVMQVARTGATATLLDSGKVLVAGGGVNTGEVFTFAAGPTGTTAAVSGTLTTIRTGHVAVKVNGGGVLLAGGSTNAAVDAYDPLSGAAGAFGASFSLSTARANAGFGFPVFVGGRAVIGGGTTSATAADYVIP